MYDELRDYLVLEYVLLEEAQMRERSQLFCDGFVPVAKAVSGDYMCWCSRPVGESAFVICPRDDEEVICCGSLLVDWLFRNAVIEAHYYYGATHRRALVELLEATARFLGRQADPRASVLGRIARSKPVSLGGGEWALVSDEYGEELLGGERYRAPWSGDAVPRWRPPL